MSAEFALQQALYSLFRNDPDVQALIGGRVYDEIPTNAAFPYVQLGESQAIDDDTECAHRLEVTFDVHVWSRATGFPQARKIAAALRTAVRDAMNAGTLTLNGAELQELRHEQSRMLRDPDGKTSHGVLTFTAIID